MKKHVFVKVKVRKLMLNNIRPRRDKDTQFKFSAVTDKNI